MAWLNNANTIATLVLAIFGIGGYLYGIISFLRKRANPVRQDVQVVASSRPKKSISSRPISWLEWIELFAKGLVTTSEFVMNLIPMEGDIEDVPVLGRVGFCAFLAAITVVGTEFVLGFSIGFLLSIMGISNPTGTAVGITTVLLFMTFSLLYIYHVGLLVEERQLRQYHQFEKEQTIRS